MSIEGRAGNIRGEEVEERVRSVLSLLPYVEEVILTPPYTPVKDLIVFFKTNTDDETIAPVDVQVKSNRKHLTAFRNKYAPRAPHEYGMDSQVWGRKREAFFAAQRLILIYAHQQKSDEEIINDFSGQLQKIEERSSHLFDQQTPRLLLLPPKE